MSGYPGQQGWGQAPPPQQGWNQYNNGPPPPQPNQWGGGAYSQQPPYSQAQYPPQQPPQQGGWSQQPSYQPQAPPYGGPQYGAPPAGGYNAAPPQAQFPPQQPPFSQAQYPPQQPQQQGGWAQQPGFGAPPQHFGPPTQPSLGYGPMQTANIDVSRDVEGIRKAMKGFGTDEKALIAILAKKDPIQINTIRTQYEQRLMRNLVSDLEKETSGYFEKGLVQIARGPLIGDCYTLYNAMKGLGTKEAALDDVLVGRSNADINAIKTEYQRLFRQSLEADLRGDLSAATEQMYVIIVSARRAEESAPVDPAAIDRDVTDLSHAMGGGPASGILGSKNAAHACEILFTRSDAQLRALSAQYATRFREPLVKAVKAKFSGHMEDALVLLLERANDRAAAEAERLEASMAGLGTKDELLVQRVVRCHWDQNFMRAVSEAYQRRYKRNLVKRIEGETRGDYERLMVACVQ